MGDAEFRQRVEHRVDQRRERAGAAGFPTALGAQRIGRGRHRMIADLHQRDVFGARQGVIHEGAGDRLAVRVVADAFHEGLPDALRDTAVQLAGDQQRIDDGAEIIDAGVAHDLHDAGLGIDLDLGDVATVGEGRRHRLGRMVDVERGGHAFRHVAFAHASREIHDVDGAVGAGDGEVAVREFDVTLGGFHQVGGRALALFDNELRGPHDRHAAGGNRARAAGAVAGMHEVAVALLELDALEGDAELVR